MYREQQALHRQWLEQQSSSLAGALCPVSRHDGLTRVSIPKIDLDVIVVEGTNHKALRLGPGHLKGTPSPGEAGNSVISAHRDTFFRHVHSLRYGDDVYLSNGGKQYHYVVKSRRVVEPTDLSVLGQTPDPELTLITCYPTHAIGPASRRLIVVAKLAH